MAELLCNITFTVFFFFLDLSESSIPRWLLELGGIYLHGYDKEGNKLCKYIQFIPQLFKTLRCMSVSQLIITELFHMYMQLISYN